MQTVIDAIWDFKKTITLKYGIEPKRIYLGLLDRRDLMRDAALPMWHVDTESQKRTFMGLTVYEVNEERHIHVC